MIKKSVIAAALLTVFAMFSAPATFATTCGVMSIVSAASTDSGSGAQVWLKNETTSACGNVAANGGTYLFNLPSTTSDKTLAVILTAMSLGKNVWVAYDDSTSPGVIQVISMQN